jgi:hypothetical protein
MLFLLLTGLAGCGSRESKVTMLAPPGAPGRISRDPAVVLDPVRGDVLLGWLSGDSTAFRVWFARSTDRGVSWSAPVAVSPPGEPLAPQGEATPRIVCDAQGRIAILWATGSVDAGGAGLPGELRFVRSLDQGRTWSRPVTLEESRPIVPRTHRFLDIAATDEGRLVAAWLWNPTPGDTSHRAAGAGASIHVAVSPDFGANWRQEPPQWSQVCPCSRGGVAMDLVGGTFAAFRRHYEDGSCDVAVARPGGSPVRAFRDGWTVAECPGSGPGFAVARDGTLRLAWFTGVPGRKGVWFRQAAPARYDSTAVPLQLMSTAAAAPLHVSLGDAGMAGTVAACDGDSLAAGPLTLFRIEASGRRVVERIAVAEARGVQRPQLAANNKLARAFVAWSERNGAEERLRMLRWDVGR